MRLPSGSTFLHKFRMLTLGSGGGGGAGSPGDDDENPRRPQVPASMKSGCRSDRALVLNDGGGGDSSLVVRVEDNNDESDDGCIDIVTKRTETTTTTTTRVVETTHTARVPKRKVGQELRDLAMLAYKASGKSARPALPADESRGTTEQRRLTDGSGDVPRAEVGRGHPPRLQLCADSSGSGADPRPAAEQRQRPRSRLSLPRGRGTSRVSRGSLSRPGASTSRGRPHDLPRTPGARIGSRTGRGSGYDESATGEPRTQPQPQARQAASISTTERPAGRQSTSPHGNSARRPVDLASRGQPSPPARGVMDLSGAATSRAQQGSSRSSSNNDSRRSASRLSTLSEAVARHRERATSLNAIFESAGIPTSSSGGETAIPSNLSDVMVDLTKFLTEEEFKALPSRTQGGTPEGCAGRGKGKGRSRTMEDPFPCSICMETVRPGEVVTTLPCQHTYHSTCIRVWLTTCSRACPVCRVDVEVCGKSREGGVDDDDEDSDFSFDM